MHLFDTLSITCRVWQIIGLSPFSLTNHQMSFVSKTSNQIFSFILITVHTLSIVPCQIFEKYIIDSTIPSYVHIVGTLILAFIQLTILVIFVESYKNRCVQMDFLQKVSTIDFILEYKIGIKLNYIDQKRLNIQRLLRWLILDVLIFMTNLMLLYCWYASLYRWAIIIYASLFVCSMRYHQITTYIHIIRHRFQQINETIQTLRLQQENTSNINIELVRTLENVRTISHKTGSVYEKIRNLRSVCRLLNSANQSINEMFQWSIPLIITNDFFHINLVTFWFIRIILLKSIRNTILPLFWASISFGHLISISSACHGTTEEVLDNI